MGKKKRSVLEPRELPARPARPGIPFAMGIRMFLIGSVAVLASIWAIWRHYARPLPPMLVPVPSASASAVDEIEVEPAQE